MTEQIKRIQEERRKQDVGCRCARGAKSVDRGCFKAARDSERKLADRRSTPKVAQLAIPEEVLKGIQASNGGSSSDPNCTPLPMGVPKMEQEIVQKIASNCVSSSTPSTPELPMGVQPAQPDEDSCGNFAGSLHPRLGLSWVCVLPKGHDGECERGGKCFKHGPYLGDKCAHWPDCVLPVAPPETPAAAQQETITLGKGWTTKRDPRRELEREYTLVAHVSTSSERITWLFDRLLEARSQLAAAESRLQEATRERERATAIERKTILTVVSIMLEGKPGAAANAVREDYPEFADLIDPFVAALSEVGAAPSQTQNAEHWIVLIEDKNGLTRSDCTYIKCACGWECGPTEYAREKLDAHAAELTNGVTPSAPDTTQLPTQEKK